MKYVSACKEEYTIVHNNGVEVRDNRGELVDSKFSYSEWAECIREGELIAPDTLMINW